MLQDCGLACRFHKILAMNNSNIPVEVEDEAIDVTINSIIEYIMPLVGSYTSENNAGEKTYYILDEIGQQLLPYTSDTESYFNSTIIEYNNIMYTVIWPETCIKEGTVVECKGLPSGFAKINKLVIALTPSVEFDPSELHFMLISNDYNVTTIMKRLGLSTVYGICLPAWDLPKFKSKNLSDTPLDLLISLFLLGSSVPLNNAEKVLGACLVSDLDVINVLYIDEAVLLPH